MRYTPLPDKEFEKSTVRVGVEVDLTPEEAEMAYYSGMSLEEYAASKLDAQAKGQLNGGVEVPGERPPKAALKVVQLNGGRGT